MKEIPYSYHIKNGRVIDPARGTDRVEDVYIKGSRIADAPEDGCGVKQVIDAKGCLVLPGLIDFHTHLNRGHSDFGIHPDLMTMPNGITSAVDAGSAGSANFEGFYRDVVCSSELTIKSFVNISPVGVITERHVEEPDPAYYDIPRLGYLFERYPQEILGLKVRIGKNFSKQFGLATLKKTKELAKDLGTVMCVHAVEPESPYDEILSNFGEGDILCHCFQGKGEYNILDINGKVASYVREARERGVIFDAAAGRANYRFEVIQRALADGFLPDIISTDVVAETIYDPRVFNLLYTMSAYIAMGMPFAEIIRAVTATPARLMNMEGIIGTLQPGALADVAILKIREQPFTFADPFGTRIPATQLLVPQMTIKAGRTAYMGIDFAF